MSSADFLHAMSSIVPSAQREVHVSVPRVTWDDIGGLSDVKRVLVEAIEWPLQHRGALLQHAMHLGPRANDTRTHSPTSRSSLARTQTHSSAWASPRRVEFSSTDLRAAPRPRW